MHHLKDFLPDPACTLLFIGYQGEGTLGRHLQTGGTTARIDGQEFPVKCQVRVDLRLLGSRRRARAGRLALELRQGRRAYRGRRQPQEGVRGPRRPRRRRGIRRAHSQRDASRRPAADLPGDGPAALSAGGLASMPRMADRPFISFMTDFGVGSSAPSVCRGVMLGIAPDARLVDVTHAIRQFAIRDGAFLLARSVPYFPVGVHVAVVDPGSAPRVGPSRCRRPAAISWSAPTTDCWSPAARALGGIVGARALENRALWLPDHFAHLPWARHLLAGRRPPGTGTPFDSLGRSPGPSTRSPTWRCPSPRRAMAGSTHRSC